MFTKPLHAHILRKFQYNGTLAKLPKVWHKRRTVPGWNSFNIYSLRYFKADRDWPSWMKVAPCGRGRASYLKLKKSKFRLGWNKC